MRINQLIAKDQLLFSVMFDEILLTGDYAF